MKQHITIKQYESLGLNSSAKRNLDIWMMDKIWYDKYSHGQLSIGQMIEFLMNHTDKLEKIETKLFNEHGLIIVFKPPSLMNFGHQIRWEHAVELCDALWEAVKEVLKS